MGGTGWPWPTPREALLYFVPIPTYCNRINFYHETIIIKLKIKIFNDNNELNKLRN